MIQSVAFPAARYVSAAAQPPDSAPPQPVAAPSVIVDVSPVATSSYVIEWRDPTTHELLLQLPMRSALPQSPGTAPATKAAGSLVTTAR